MNVLYSLWAVYLFIGLGVTADAFFVPTLTRISGIFLSSRLIYTEIPVVFLEYWPHYMAHMIWSNDIVGKMSEVRLFGENLER